MIDIERHIKNLNVLAAFLNFKYDDRKTVWDDLKASNYELFTIINYNYREWPGPEQGSWTPHGLEEVDEIWANISTRVENLLDSKTQRGELLFCVSEANRILQPSWEVQRSRTKQGWSVERSISSFKLLDFLYATIIMALEDREFFRLGRCKDCTRFFIAGHGNRKYCPSCDRETFHKKHQAARMRKSRQKRERELKQKGIPLLRSLTEAQAKILRDKTNSEGLYWEEIRRRIQTKREDPSKIWDKLPPRFKRNIASL